MKTADIRHLPAGSPKAATVDVSPRDLTARTTKHGGDDPAAIFGYPWGDPKPAIHASWTARLFRHQPTAVA